SSNSVVGTQVRIGAVRYARRATVQKRGSTLSIEVGTGSARFCTSCGTRLENGACPKPHGEPDHAGAPRTTARIATPSAFQVERERPPVSPVSSYAGIQLRSQSNLKRIASRVLSATVVVALVVALVAVA